MQKNASYLRIGSKSQKSKEYILSICYHWYIILSKYGSFCNKIFTIKHLQLLSTLISTSFSTSLWNRVISPCMDGISRSVSTCCATPCHVGPCLIRDSWNLSQEYQPVFSCLPLMNPSSYTWSTAIRLWRWCRSPKSLSGPLNRSWHCEVDTAYRTGSRHTPMMRAGSLSAYPSTDLFSPITFAW